MTEHETAVLAAAAPWRRQERDLSGLPIVLAWNTLKGFCWVWCPYCGRLHYHTLPDGVSTKIRVSHCASLSLVGEYVLDVVPGPIPDPVKRAAVVHARQQEVPHD